MAGPRWTAQANRKPNHFNEIQLMDEIGKIIHAYNQVRYENEPANKIEYVAAYPDYVFELTGEESKTNRPSRIICYDIIKKDSGSLGTNRFDNTKRVRPVVVESRPIIIDEGTPQERSGRENVYLKHYDVLLRFDCLAPSDRESMILAREFEKIMEAHSMYLETGVQRFVYHGRTASYFNRQTEYKSRTCQFFAQVQEIWSDIGDQIRHINITYLHFSGEVLF